MSNYLHWCILDINLSWYNCLNSAFCLVKWHCETSLSPWNFIFTLVKSLLFRGLRHLFGHKESSRSCCLEHVQVRDIDKAVKLIPPVNPDVWWCRNDLPGCFHIASIALIMLSFLVVLRQSYQVKTLYITMSIPFSSSSSSSSSSSPPPPPPPPLICSLPSLHHLLVALSCHHLTMDRELFFHPHCSSTHSSYPCLSTHGTFIGTETSMDWATLHESCSVWRKTGLRGLLISCSTPRLRLVYSVCVPWRQ